MKCSYVMVIFHAHDSIHFHYSFFQYHLLGRDTDYGRVARDFEAVVDHIIVQAVYQAASNLDGTSNEVETATKENMMVSSDMNHAQGAPSISTVKQSPISTESVQQDIHGAVSAIDTNSENVAAITTQHDTKPSANLNENEV